MPGLPVSGASAPTRGVERKWQTTSADQFNRRAARGRHARDTRASGIPTTGGRFAPLCSVAEDDGLEADVTSRAATESSDPPVREAYPARRKQGQAESPTVGTGR
jgi:hypothetical protein